MLEPVTTGIMRERVHMAGIPERIRTPAAFVPGECYIHGTMPLGHD